MKENATKPFEKLVSLLCLEGPIFTPGHDVEARLRVTCVGDLKKKKKEKILIIVEMRCGFF